MVIVVYDERLRSRVFLILGQAMNLSTRRRPLTALFLAAVMFITSLPLGVAQAGMISTQTLIEQQNADVSASARPETSREHIRDILARDDVRAEMIALGITPDEAEARIASLTDQEVAGIAGRLDQLPAGEGVGSILIIIFVIFGVAVLMDALGLLNIFPFVCGPGQCGNVQQVQAFEVEPAAPPVQAEPGVYYDDRRSSFRRDQFGSYDGRTQRGFDSNQYYEPQPAPQSPSRSYYDERFGTQRYVR